MIEFKSVARPFGVRDLRQLILYGVLAELGPPPSPQALVLVNPLQGLFIRFDKDRLAMVVSGVPFRELAVNLGEDLVGLGVSE